MTTIDHSSLPLYTQRILTPPPTATVPSVITSRPLLQFTTPGSSLSLPSSPFSNPRSQNTFLPKSALRQSSDHVANLKKLHALQACLHKREFWDESAILERMHYKNKSQHRQAVHFQRLCECRRLVARIRELDIAGLVDELLKKFYSGKSLKTVASSKSQWDSIPYRSTIAFVMTRIIGAIMLLRKTQTALYETYGSFYQLLSTTQFMSFALIAVGLCSRLSLISKAWTSELVYCYDLLGTWIRSFPKEENPSDLVDYEAQLPESLDSILASSVPETPLSLPPTVSPSHAGEKSAIEGADLGEIIQRRELSREPELSSRAQPSPSEPSSPIETEIDSCDHNQGMDKRHHSLLSELDSVFGSASSQAPQSKKKRTAMTLPNSNQFPEAATKKALKLKDKRTGEEGARQMIKGIPKSAKVSSTHSSPGPSSSSGGKGGGSITNFDDIFSFDRPATAPPGKSPGSAASFKQAREIDDIFGTIAGPAKKKKKSRI